MSMFFSRIRGNKQDRERRNKTETGINFFVERDDDGHLRPKAQSQSRPESPTYSKNATEEENGEQLMEGRVKKLRERYKDFSGSANALNSESSSSHKSEKKETHLFQKGQVKNTAKLLEESGRRTIISHRTSSINIPNAWKSECSLVENQEASSVTKEDLLDWHIIDAEEDDELREMKGLLSEMEPISRGRAESIMKHQGFYQDIAAVSMSYSSEHSSLADASSSSTFSTKTTDMSTSEHGLDSIPEDSPVKPTSGKQRKQRKRKAGLWREQEHVINSGILEKLSERELALQEALFEIITSEESNLKSLDVLVNHFKSSLENPQKISALEGKNSKVQPEKGKPVLGKYEINRLFFNVEMLKECSEKFLAFVEHLQGDNYMIVNFFNHWSDRTETIFGRSIVKYCKNIEHQTELLKKLTRENLVFAETVKVLEQDESLNDKTFKSFLVVPLNRICHIPLLLERIIKISQKLDDSYSKEIHDSAVKAHEIMKRIASTCNKETKKLEELVVQQNILLSIERQLIIPLNIKLSIVAKNRSFYYGCTVSHIIESPGRFTKHSESSIRLLLFTDMLIFCTPCGQTVYKLQDVADIHKGNLVYFEFNNDTEEEFAAKRKFFNASNKYKNLAVSMIFFNTQLGLPENIERSEALLKKGEKQQEMSHNCFKDRDNVFVFQSVEAKETFLTKLKEAQEELAIQLEDEDTTKDSQLKAIHKRRSQSIKKKNEIARHNSDTPLSKAALTDYEDEDEEDGESESTIEQVKVISKIQYHAFTPLVRRKPPPVLVQGLPDSDIDNDDTFEEDN